MIVIIKKTINQLHHSHSSPPAMFCLSDSFNRIPSRRHRSSPHTSSTLTLPLLIDAVKIYQPRTALARWQPTIPIAIATAECWVAECGRDLYFSINSRFVHHGKWIFSLFFIILRWRYAFLCVESISQNKFDYISWLK